MITYWSMVYVGYSQVKYDPHSNFNFLATAVLAIVLDLTFHQISFICFAFPLCLVLAAIKFAFRDNSKFKIV